MSHGPHSDQPLQRVAARSTIRRIWKAETCCLPKNHSKRKIEERRVSYDGMMMTMMNATLTCCAHHRNARMFLEKNNVINLQTTNNGLIELSDLRTKYKLWSFTLSLIYAYGFDWFIWTERVLIVSCFGIYILFCLVSFFSESAVREFCLRIEIRLLKMLIF